MPLNLPIILTWVRIAMIPLVVSVYYVPEHVLPTAVRDAVATGMFIFAALTDWLDGWLARRLNQTSSFGAFLDPVADKLMVSAALLVLLNLGRVDAMIAGHHRPRDHHFGPARVDGQDRRQHQRRRALAGQVQDRGADDRHPVPAVWRAGIGHRRAVVGIAADRDRRRAHGVVDDVLPAAGLAGHPAIGVGRRQGQDSRRRPQCKKQETTCSKYWPPPG